MRPGGVFLVVAGVALTACAASESSQPADYAFTNASWFDGERFETRTVYVRDGRFVDDADRAARTVDLGGGFASPPLCEAHNHNLGGPDEPQETSNAYLRAGVFYVGIMSNLPALTQEVEHHFNHPAAIDAIFANGPLTGPRGHPVTLRERLLEWGSYPGFTVETLPGQGYYEIADAAALEAAWPEILAQEPGVIKVMLLYSDEYEQRADDPEYEGNRGIDPALMPDLVERAHAAGLRVFVHIENAADLRTAALSGADVAAHMPGNSAPDAITAEDARVVAEEGLTVVTTASLGQRLQQRDPDAFTGLFAQQTENLRLLHEAGVTLAVGSDGFRDTSHAEAAYLRETGVFTDAELLTMWTRNCAETLYPGRRLGRVAEGYEANFIVFGNDPLEDWAALETITYRFKDGEPLSLPAPPPEAE